MKALFKKSLAVLLSAMLLFTAAPFAASAAVALQEQSVGASSGTTGDCTWTVLFIFFILFAVGNEYQNRCH